VDKPLDLQMEVVAAMDELVKTREHLGSPWSPCEVLGSVLVREAHITRSEGTKLVISSRRLREDVVQPLREAAITSLTDIALAIDTFHAVRAVEWIESPRYFMNRMARMGVPSKKLKNVCGGRKARRPPRFSHGLLPSLRAYSFGFVRRGRYWIGAGGRGSGTSQRAQLGTGGHL
jgi:hypothetical protein